MQAVWSASSSTALRTRSCCVSVLSFGRMCSDLLIARSSPMAATVYRAMSSSVLITTAVRVGA